MTRMQSAAPKANMKANLNFSTYGRAAITSGACALASTANVIQKRPRSQKARNAGSGTIKAAAAQTTAPHQPYARELLKERSAVAPPTAAAIAFVLQPGFQSTAIRLWRFMRSSKAQS